MITSVKQLLGENDVNAGKWVKLLPEEQAAVIDSIAGENAVRGNTLKHSGLRHFVDRGYIAVHDMGGDCLPHPLDEKK